MTRVLITVFCFGAASAINLRSVGNKQTGHDLGVSIVSSNRLASAGGEGAAYHSEIADTISADQQVVVNSQVSKVIAQTNSLANQRTLGEDSLCARNWDAPCPDGWDSLGNSVCSAPDSYLGACATTQSFADSSLLAKSKFADECKAPWPCQGGCSGGSDYDACPVEWTSSGPGFCSGSSVQGCSSEYKFDSMSIAQKQELAAACGIQWACKGECSQDYSDACPQGWTEFSTMCVAPPTYTGDCSSSISTAGMTAGQKKEFADKCGVRFRCKGM